MLSQLLFDQEVRFKNQDGSCNCTFTVPAWFVYLLRTLPCLMNRMVLTLFSISLIEIGV